MKLNQNQYFGCIGWHWNCAEIPATTLAPLYAKPLGAPLGPHTTTLIPIAGTTNGVTMVYSREFKYGVKVILNASHGMGTRGWVRCCIAYFSQPQR